MNADSIRLLRLWLAEGRYVWITLGSTALALLICLRPGTNEPLIRWTGLILQILGIATVVWGIAETRAFFGRTPILKAAIAWIERFPLWKRKIDLAAACAVSVSATATMNGYVTHGFGPQRTIESRLDALEKNISAVHDRITSTEKEMGQQFHKANESLTIEITARIAEDERNRGMLETSATGGVHISSIGATWLFVGVFLSTTAPELAAWLK